MKNTLLPLWSFQGARELHARENRLSGRSLKTQQQYKREVDISI
jgi:hypothetical protein